MNRQSNARGLDRDLAILPTRQRFAKRAELDAQIGLIDRHTRPDQPHQRVRGYDRAGALDQRNQHVKSPAAKLDRLAI